jgi:tungstate transport system permease protein
VSFFSQGLEQAWNMIIHGDPYLRHVTWITIKVAAIPTAIASVIGLPLGLALGIGRFRGRRIGIAIANAGLALPPVVVGLVLTLLFFPEAPLGRLHLLFTLNGVYVAQTILALPIVVALSTAAFTVLPTGLLDQARAFGAGRVQVSVLALREARVGIMAAVIAAVGSGLSEVGAVVLVGGNIEGLDQTLASAALQRVNAGQFALGMAIAIILIGFIIIVGALLTLLQFRSPTLIRPGARS